ncbi:MAG: UDP-N-acetylmuramoyl-L-alanine--D-glutamate ligase [Ignavibacteriae bacterium]|nr:UDP-N-acetylmuramoyl-L-alanine--D-glutamate ligase [Ignavibacteriota bacterium]NOG97530.1 UDP-N-acetylmuramoyl-L-alanine--D-glutamate ligase [Ignavibacteriota bacterium]
MNIRDKKISILGAVRSGIGAAKLAASQGAVPFVSDMSADENVIENCKELEKLNIAFEYGGHTDRVFDCDFVITSPGVPNNSTVLQKCREKNIKVVSEIEFASWFCKGRIISITGTNGKTTTTALCAHALNTCGLKTYSAGNIGTAFSEVVLDVKENEIVALETSSFQLDYIDKFKPMITIILNITPDHLDRYENAFKKYIDSKLGVTKNQTAEDYFIFNADDKNTPAEIDNNLVNRYSFSLMAEQKYGAYISENNFVFAEDLNLEEVCSIDDLFIKGEHNIANALAVLITAKILKLSNDKIKLGFSSFKGVEHRLEFVRELNGVKYFNDSKATNIDSVWYALRTFDSPIHLILGGIDKGNDYSIIESLVSERVKKIYAIGTSAEKIFSYFSKKVEVEKMESLEAAIEKAKIEAVQNEIVLLSPACASFDMFKNYEHRGNVFKEKVNSLN